MHLQGKRVAGIEIDRGWFWFYLDSLAFGTWWQLMAPPTPRSSYTPRGAYLQIEGFFCFNLINVSPNLPPTAQGPRLPSMIADLVKSDPLPLLPCCSSWVFVFLINTSHWHGRSTIELWIVLCNVLAHLMAIIALVNDIVFLSTNMNHALIFCCSKYLSYYLWNIKLLIININFIYTKHTYTYEINRFVLR